MVLSYGYRLIETVHMCLVLGVIFRQMILLHWDMLLPTFCLNNILE
jgi:hypothetical protein